MAFPPPTPRQARLIWLALSGLAIAALVGLVVAAFWGFGRVVQVLSPVLWPLAVAGVLAYLLDPVVDFLEKKGAPRTRAIMMVFLLAVFILAGLLSSVVPQIATETRDLARQVPEYTQRVEKRAQQWLTNPPRLIRQILDWNRTQDKTGEPGAITDESGRLVVTNTPPSASAQGTNAPASFQSLFGDGNLQTATGWLAKILPKIGSWLLDQLGRVASWFGVLAGLVLIPVYLFYFLLEKSAISSRWTDYLPVSDSKFKEELVFVLSAINDYLIAFFRGQVLVAICDGVLYAIGFLIIGLPYAVLLGAAAVFLTIIPYIGAFVVCSTALVIALVQFGDWTHPLLVAAVFGIVQMIEGFVVAPKIMGDRVGLHPVAIIIAVVVGTTLLGGILGGILAIPLTAALKVLMFRYVWKRRVPEGISPR